MVAQKRSAHQITEAQRARNESEERFRKVFENAAEGIEITDMAGNIVMCNAAYSIMTGYSKDELVDQVFSSLIYPDDRAANLELTRQWMATLTIDLQSFSRSTAASEPSLDTRLHRAGKMAEQITTDLQRLVHQLHFSLLEHAGLEAAVLELVQEFETGAVVKTNVVVRNFPAILSVDRATCLYRVLQECLQTVRKHANASNVLVRLLGTRGGVGLCINDDGRGFDVAQESAGRRKGLGLISRGERLGMLNGTFRIQSKRGYGTEVHV